MDSKFKILIGVLIVLVLGFCAVAVFAINEGTSTPVTPSANNSYITNATGATYRFQFTNSVDLGVTTTCFIEFDHDGTNTSMTNASTTSWNYTLTSITDTTWNTYSNVSYKCNSTDNTADKNLWNITEAVYQYKFDRTAPSAYAWLSSELLYQGSNKLNFTYEFTDNNKDTAFVKVCKPTYSYSAVTTCSAWDKSLSATVTDSAAAGYMNYTASPSELYVSDGMHVVSNYEVDKVGLTASGTNVSMLIQKCSANAWCMLSYENTAPATTGTIAGNLTGVTSVATFDNAYNSKTYTTYSTSAPTVNNDTAIASGTPFVIYTTADVYWVQNMTSDDSVYTGLKEINNTAPTGYSNWAMVPTYNDTTMYKILRANQTSGYTNAIKEVCMWDDANKKYVCCRRELNICTGTTSVPTAVAIPRGSNVWMMTNSSITDLIYVNMTVLTGA